MTLDPGERLLLPDHEVIAQIPVVPETWRRDLDVDDDVWVDLWRFLIDEYAQKTVYPSKHQIFRALELTPLRDVRVVILGQDPYHGPGEAHGLAFSVPPATPFPPSLRNVLDELEADLGHPRPQDGSLDRWARQGVLLLNTCLTVRRAHAESHMNRGWEDFTSAVLQAVVMKADPVVFVLWGRKAVNVLRNLYRRMSEEYPFARSAMRKHVILTSTHPSPLSAGGHPGASLRPFVGSRPFSRVNAELEARGLKRIRWDLNPPGDEEVIYEAWTDGSGTVADQPTGIGVVVDRVTVGWTGQPCGDCKGTGEHDDLGGCPQCGGTGDEYGETYREQLHRVSETAGLGTNNHAELSAVLKALTLVPREARLIIRADSEYAIGCSTKPWNPKVNVELIGKIKAELAQRGDRVTFRHIRGHNGDPGNELADRLAGAARKSQLP